MTDVWLVVLAPVLLALSAMLRVAGLTLIRMTSGKGDRSALAGLEDRAATAVAEQPDRYVQSVLLSSMGLLVGHVVLVGQIVSSLPLGANVGAIALDISIVFVVADLVPRAVVSSRWASLTRPALRTGLFFGRFPITRAATWVVVGLGSLIAGRSASVATPVSERELLALAEEAADADIIDAGESDYIASILEFGDRVVREIMIPRPDMVAVTVDFTAEAIAQVALLKGLSRFPVIVDSMDDIVGVVHAFEAFRSLQDDRDATAADLMRPVGFVPETKGAPDLLKEMLRTRGTGGAASSARSHSAAPTRTDGTERGHMVIVVDEYGGTAGLVTLEDLLEELVGDIVDEFDQESVPFHRLDDRVVIVDDPSINVHDINEGADLELPSGDWDSVGGVVLAHVGTVPGVGDSVTVGPYVITVLASSGQRISRLRIESTDESIDGDGHDGDDG